MNYNINDIKVSLKSIISKSESFYNNLLEIKKIGKGVFSNKLIINIENLLKKIKNLIKSLNSKLEYLDNLSIKGKNLNDSDITRINALIEKVKISFCGYNDLIELINAKFITTKLSLITHSFNFDKIKDIQKQLQEYLNLLLENTNLDFSTKQDINYVNKDELSDLNKNILSNLSDINLIDNNFYQDIVKRYNDLKIEHDIEKSINDIVMENNEIFNKLGYLTNKKLNVEINEEHLKSVKDTFMNDI